VREPGINADRLAYGCVLAVLTALGLASKLYAGPGASWTSGYAGGFFYVLFWVFLVLVFSPRSSPGAAAVWVLGITSALEGLQLWHPPFLQRIRSTFLGHALLGSTFSGWDFAYYALGAIAAPVLARGARSFRAAQAAAPVETLQEKIARVVKEHVAVVPYDPDWPAMFERERDHLLACLPNDLVKRVEHIGSTAVPGLAAKPIVDVLVEVSDLEETKTRIAPLLEAQGYDYFWRPSSGDDTPPFYAWFIKRDGSGVRTHHIHMVEAHFEHWDRLLFRDYLIQHPEVAREYAELKIRLSERHDRDRVAYTQAKSDFVAAVTAKAKEHFRRRS
jgi:GrpB-like predicted nucleotidyltransferase (UPF0157 family)